MNDVDIKDYLRPKTKTQSEESQFVVIAKYYYRDEMGGMHRVIPKYMLQILPDCLLNRHNYSNKIFFVHVLNTN